MPTMFGRRLLPRSWAILLTDSTNDHISPPGCVRRLTTKVVKYDIIGHITDMSKWLSVFERSLPRRSGADEMLLSARYCVAVERTRCYWALARRSGADEMLLSARYLDAVERTRCCMGDATYPADPAAAGPIIWRLNSVELSAQLRNLGTSFSKERRTTTISLSECLQYLRRLSPAEKSFYSEVVRLARLILVMPATNAVSERCFSAMRRLKTYLRSTMQQSRLNHVMLLHIHKELLDQLNLVDIGNEFVRESEHRARVFGSFN